MKGSDPPQMLTTVVFSASIFQITHIGSCLLYFMLLCFSNCYYVGSLFFIIILFVVYSASIFQITPINMLFYF